MIPQKVGGPKKNLLAALTKIGPGPPLLNPWRRPCSVATLGKALEISLNQNNRGSIPVNSITLNFLNLLKNK